jgi:hypothetical protein
MQRRYKRKKRGGSKRIVILIALAMGVLALALAWVWKSNQVKEYYATMKRRETERNDIIAENMHLRAKLLDLKSLSSINKVVTKRFGLTQNVSQRIFISDPVKQDRRPNTLDLVGDLKDVPDWIDNAVFNAGRIRAESEKRKEGQ